MNYLVMKLRIKRINCPIVYQCALLCSYLKSKNIEATVKKGFIEFGDMHCPHVWVETNDGEKFDIATYQGVRFAPELSRFGIKLLETPSETSKIMDVNDEQKRMILETESHYELYSTDIKRFWKERPLRLRNFKI